MKESARPGQSNDVASIAEVTRRRFLRHRQDREATAADTASALGDEIAGGDAAASDRRFAYPPQLYIVDGGAPQVQAAADVLAELGISDVAVCGIAKRLEEIWLPDDPEPLILSRHSEALFLIQRIRDEAHRFAITHHRSRRDKKVRASALDGIAGIGPAKKQALLRAFGSVAQIRAASVEEIAAVEGFGPRLAEVVHTALH